MDSIPKYFYRFRKIATLLDEHNELETQEIYFASPEELNDPMEGFRDIFWQGDVIVWRNLFRNYLFCLERLCFLLVLVGESEPLDANMIPVLGNENQLPTEEVKKISREIYKAFFSNTAVEKYIDRLSRRSKTIKRNELYSHLFNIHLFALETILQLFEEKGLKPKREQTIPLIDLENKILQLVSVIDNLEQIESENPSAVAEAYYAALRHTYAQMDLIGKSSYSNLSEFKNRDFVIRDFPGEYLNKLEELIYPEWYTACFMSDCSNASVWGHYGDNHRGICLKFKASITGEQPAINLNCVIGWGSQGAISGIRGHQFHKVTYSQEYVEIDFFKSLGRLPIPDLKTFWYTNNDGELSDCAEEIISPSNEKWRERYWEKFHLGVTTKSEDWRYENEYRLLLHGLFLDYKQPAERKLKYNFNDLDGIIFGIKTKTEDKLRIMKIIDEKCQKEGRKGFNFYQAFFSKEKNCIDFSLMSLIKFAD